MKNFKLPTVCQQDSIPVKENEIYSWEENEIYSWEEKRAIKKLREVLNSRKKKEEIIIKRPKRKFNLGE